MYYVLKFTSFSSKKRYNQTSDHLSSSYVQFNLSLIIYKFSLLFNSNIYVISIFDVTNNLNQLFVHLYKRIN